METSLNYTIRLLRENEVPILDTFLYEAIYVPEGVLPPPRDITADPSLQVYIHDFGADPNDCCFVAEIEAPTDMALCGQIVGAVWTRIMDDYGHVDNRTPSLAISLVPEYRHRGIGTALMKVILNELRARGYHAVSLSVQKANYAVHLYQRLGFETICENDAEFIMVKTLS